MNFPLDFVWVREGKIAEITKNVWPPAAGKKPVPFYPGQPVSAVLEVPAGYADSQGWAVGMAVSVRP